MQLKNSISLTVLRCSYLQYEDTTRDSPEKKQKILVHLFLYMYSSYNRFCQFKRLIHR